MVNLIIPTKKPIFDISSPPLCDFRTSKAYLWGLIKQRLSTIVFDSNSSLNALDAACHSAITRQMFPSSLSYYGLDISLTRLRSAVNHSRDSDIFYHCDLTKPIPFNSAFDIVVSCNTLSHIPSDQQLYVLTNLLSFLKPGGHLFVNTSIDSLLFHFLQKLLPLFSSVEVTYFDSWLSYENEPPRSNSKLNVVETLDKFEFSIVNDACLHRQVLFSCTSLISSSAPSFPLRPSSGRLLQLNRIPNIVARNFDCDRSLLDDPLIISKVTHALFTPFLYDHSASNFISAHFKHLKISCLKLDANLSLEELKSSTVVVLGLESQWVGDTYAVRRTLNSIRSLSDISIQFIYVERRDGISSTPSPLLSDL